MRPAVDRTATGCVPGRTVWFAWYPAGDTLREAREAHRAPHLRCAHVGSISGAEAATTVHVGLPPPEPTHEVPIVATTPKAPSPQPQRAPCQSLHPPRAACLIDTNIAVQPSTTAPRGTSDVLGNVSTDTPANLGAAVPDSQAASTVPRFEFEFECAYRHARGVLLGKRR